MKLGQARRSRSLGMWLLACALAAGANAHAQLVPEQKKILYMSAEGLDHQYYAKAYTAFKDELDKVLPNATTLYVANMDLARFSDPASKARLTAWMRDKYVDTRLDAIVTAGTPALRFAIESQLWPGVPTYFSNTNDAVVAAMKLPPNVTGQTFTVNFGQTVQLIRKVLPATKRIVLVGNIASEDIYRPFIDSELAHYLREFTFIDLRGKPVEQVLKRIATLEPDTVIYRTVLTRDSTGRTYDPFTLMNLTARAANRPMFVDYSPFITKGVLGGVAIDPEAQGRNAARHVALLLRGVAPGSIPVMKMDFAPTFDWRELERWGIARADLPAGSQVWFYTPTLWEQYRLQFALTLALIVVLTALVVALLVERRRRAIAVAEARERLTELAHLNRNATALVYSGAIAHELNQPLAAILTNAQAARMMLATDPPALAEVREILDDIERDDQRAADLIRSMRGLLKKGSGGQRKLDINDVVCKAVLFIAPEARMRRVSLRVALPEEAVWVCADQVQLQQVLINLIVNAMQAMADASMSSGEVVVAVATAQPGELSVSVSDSGPGFSADVKAAFTAFATTKVHGTGLGLAITAALVREHSGSITAANLAGGGACVTFILPRVQPPQPPQPPQPTPCETAGTPGPLQQPTLPPSPHLAQ